MQADVLARQGHDGNGQPRQADDEQTVLDGHELIGDHEQVSGASCASEGASGLAADVDTESNGANRRAEKDAHDALEARRAESTLVLDLLAARELMLAHG